MNCLIVGSDQKSCKPLEKIIRQSGYFTLVSVYAHAAQPGNKMPEHKADIIFIDMLVQTKQADGFINYINDHKPHVVAVSTTAEIGKINFNITDIIIKPFSNVQLKRVVNKILLTKGNKKIKSDKEASFIFVKVNRTIEKIDLTNIYYVQALSDYVRIFTHEKVYTTYSTMNEMLNKLPEKNFLRVHRSYIVRLEAIAQFQEGFLTIDERLIPIGKTYKKDLMERLLI